jgi:hypothetical protein
VLAYVIELVGNMGSDGVKRGEEQAAPASDSIGEMRG